MNGPTLKTSLRSLGQGSGVFMFLKALICNVSEFNGPTMIDFKFPTW